MLKFEKRHLRVPFSFSELSWQRSVPMPAFVAKLKIQSIGRALMGLHGGVKPARLSVPPPG
jgi:hypothetical protein